MVTPRIRFLFDFISPYAYLAWTQIHEVAGRLGAEVEPAPVLFAALLNAYGHKGPVEIPPKRAYVFKDALRRARRLGLSLSLPPAHPFNPLLALRAASLEMPVSTRRRLIDGLFVATWGGGAGVESPAEVARIAAEVGLDGEATVREAQGGEAKARVRAQTEEALAAGAFGVPTMLVGQELFWGADSLGDLEAYVRGEDPIAALDADLLARWARLPATATRR